MLKLIYCDKIAHIIKEHFKSSDYGFKFNELKYDLHPKHGYFISTKKTILMTGNNGVKYKITIEEDLSI